MKCFVLSILFILTLNAPAQTTPPTVAKLVDLLIDGSATAVDDYGTELGYTNVYLGYTSKGKDYTYNYFYFSSPDSSVSSDYLYYVCGEYAPNHAYKLAAISFGTNSDSIFATLQNEITALGAEEIKLPDVATDPDYHCYRYRGINITIPSDPALRNKHAINISISGIY